MTHTSSIEKKVGEWLEAEGYPLEFATAAAFSSTGMSVHQGDHIEDVEQGRPREVDVLAEANDFHDECSTRVECVIECKWSSDKPWVVFVSENRIAPSACIAQTLASDAAALFLWARAGDESLQQLRLFEVPEMPGVGGRQAFSSGRDLFYEAVRSVASIALCEGAQV